MSGPLAFVQLLVVLEILTWSPASGVKNTTKPNIIFILADDLGFDDIGFHGSPQIPTPNIDELANTGVILNNYYVQPICTPTRSALMSGKYPIHTGMQHSVILAKQPYGLGLDNKLMPEYFKELGYATHIVGKWHLGFFDWKYTPTERGFDSFFGYYCGKEDYWDHSNRYGKDWALDLRDNTEPVWKEWGNYSTYLFTDKAIDIINTHDKTKPLFLYLPYQAVHSANYIQPIQAPPELVKKFENISNVDRRTFAAVVSALDTSIGKVVSALKARGLYDNSVIVFSTDNGGPANGFDMNMACNFPLRGVKATLWEGGVRGAGFVHSPLLAKKGRVSMEMVHVSDWLPSLYTLAGGDIHNLHSIDGMDVWNSISSGEYSPREQILLNIDPITGEAAFRFNKWKLIVNESSGWSGWYSPPGVEELRNVPRPHTLKNAVVTCGKPPTVPCECTYKAGPCLFDLDEDPCEYVNLASKNPEIVDTMLNWLEKYKLTMVKPKNVPDDAAADPRNFNGVWTPWRGRKPTEKS